VVGLGGNVLALQDRPVHRGAEQVGGYARIDGTMLARTGGIPGTVWNEVEFDFGTPSVGWGVVVAIGVHKADGTLWFWIPVTPGINCPAGAPVSITTETLIEYIS
jgi:hypothetical protein